MAARRHRPAMISAPCFRPFASPFPKAGLCARLPVLPRYPGPGHLPRECPMPRRVQDRVCFICAGSDHQVTVPRARLGDWVRPSTVPLFVGHSCLSGQFLGLLVRLSNGPSVRRPTAQIDGSFGSQFVCRSVGLVSFTQSNVRSACVTDYGAWSYWWYRIFRRHRKGW